LASEAWQTPARRGLAKARAGAIDLPIFIIDAFAERPLTGNPAAVCPLKGWLPTATMQAIAAEMNLSETAFFAPEADGAFGIAGLRRAARLI